MTKSLKIKLMAYAAISAMTFSYLIMPENAGISVPIFSAIQFICLFFVVPERKKLVLFIPIFLLSLNSFISANSIWHISNLFVTIGLYACMFIKIDFCDTSLIFFSQLLTNVFQPLAHLTLPAKWSLELTNDKAPILKRLGIAAIITLPCIILLTFILSSADMIFWLKTEAIFTRFFENISFHSLFIII